MTPIASSSLPLSIACLCAAWCRTCEGYRPVLDDVASGFIARGLAHSPRWVDIEDEAEILGDIDVETFPTVLVFDDERVYFAGPVLPRPEHLQRLLANITESSSPAGAVAEEWEAFVARLRSTGPAAR